MRVITSIDIGSISVRMIVAAIENEQLVPVYQDLQMTRLGKGIGKFRRLDDEAIQRTMTVLKKYEEIADRYHSEEILAVATSAVRDAENGDDFLYLIKMKSKIHARIIDGREEAKLTFQGAYHSLGAVDPVMLIDIGGGSTEIIGGDRNQTSFLASINAGAVRDTEAYLKSDPPNPSEIEELAIHLTSLFCKHINGVNRKQYQTLIGVGGTITSLAAMAQNLTEYQRNKVHQYVLTMTKLESMTDLLSQLTVKQRKSISGLQPERADIILAGAIILQQFMKQFEWDKITVSESDILEGIILQYIQAESMNASKEENE